MIRNFITVAFRNISRQKSYFLINTTGLAIGIASSIIIMLFVINELSYDHFHENYKQIYRVYIDGEIGGTTVKAAWTAPPTSKVLKKEIPEIISEVRTDHWNETVIKVDGKNYIEKYFMLADTSFFNIFSFKLIEGDPDTALANPYSIVLTKNTAEKFFGNKDPLGKKIYVNTDTNYYTVTGIIENGPENSHFHFDLIGSFSSHWMAKSESWLTNSFSCYILLKDGAPIKDIERRINSVAKVYFSPELEATMGITFDEWVERGNKYQFLLQPLGDIHLDTTIQHSARVSNNKKYVYIFSIVALLIIVVAAINYMNLSTAKSAKRSKEVGLRKVAGSPRTLLIAQFLFESVLLCFISLLLAIIIVQLTLPFINKITQLELSLDLLSNFYLIPVLFLFPIVIGILAGSYPSFYLSAFNPVTVISGTKKRTRKSILRNVLVVFQFAISIIIILGATTIYRQINYMINKYPGFDKDHLLIIKSADALGSYENIKKFQDEIKKIPGVVSSTSSTSVPHHSYETRAFISEETKNTGTILFHMNYVDDNYLNTYKIKLKQGRFLSYDENDSLSVVINESAVARYGISDPLSFQITHPDTLKNPSIFKIVGVVENFHFQSFHEDIHPYAFILKPMWWNWGGFISIRITKEKIKSTISEINKIWDKMTSYDPFQYYFMTEEFDSIYSEEIRTGNITMGFAVLAILIACLGLFGLTSYASEQRTKEIGIRKVMGSSIWRIIMLLTMQIFYLIVISTVLAWPVAYFIMKKWLNNFHYHENLSIWEFLFSFIIAILVAMLTVTYRAYTAASSDPVKALKYE